MEQSASGDSTELRISTPCAMNDERLTLIRQSFFGESGVTSQKGSVVSAK
jgi:hypothetical protein